MKKDTCIPLFIVALFTIARTWKQPICPSTDEWIKKLWYINTMEYYSAIKRNAFESVLMSWMNLEPVIQKNGTEEFICKAAMEKARGFQKNIYFCFIDYAKAFDCVDHNKLWKILRWEYQTT